MTPCGENAGTNVFTHARKPADKQWNGRQHANGMKHAYLRKQHTSWDADDAVGILQARCNHRSCEHDVVEHVLRPVVGAYRTHVGDGIVDMRRNLLARPCPYPSQPYLSISYGPDVA